MKLTDYSRIRIVKTFANWQVPKDFSDPMYNYLVHGFSPGGCFTSVLANDFHGAISRSHPANTIEAFKALGGWVLDTVPEEARGSYKNVEVWCNSSDNIRRTILIRQSLIYTEEEELMLVLKNSPLSEPVLY